MIDSYRDLLSGATDLYLPNVSNRQKDVMKQLTVITTSSSAGFITVLRSDGRIRIVPLTGPGHRDRATLDELSDGLAEPLLEQLTFEQRERSVAVPLDRVA